MAKLPCPPELWPRFSALLDQAIDLPDDRRQQWLKSLGSEHAAVLPWLIKVLAGNAGESDTGFLGSPATAERETEYFAGHKVGPYVLERWLGGGGMGEVWLASRTDGTLNRQVALKLPHPHLMAAVLLRRFERERDILAALSHPNIALLYDAGVDESHHPYLAMEWVDGRSIIEHCHAARLSLDARLDLFLQLLDAVGYAHQRLIAHRDIKPSNILVTGAHRAKLLDFGIAKLLNADTDSGATQLTQVGSRLATPAYAAPEQLTGQPITVAVDFYALGVVFFELLTGARPFREGVKAAARGDAPRASSQITTEHAARVGGLDLKALRKSLSGDLDAIIGKALEADPAKRYRSAEAFASDIERSRQHRPISARRLSPATLTWKFIRRHSLGVSMSAGMLLLLIGGSIGIGWQAVRAEREAERATSIKDFLVGVFRASDPRIAKDKPRGEITAHELLDISTSRIESEFARQSATQIELLDVTADIYRELDETQQSTLLYARETALARSIYGPADAHAIDGLLGQAYNADSDGNTGRALALLSEADPLIHRARLDTSATRARWLMIRGDAWASDPLRAQSAVDSLQAAAALFRAAAPRDALYPEALIDLGGISVEQSQFAAAVGYYREAITVVGPNPQFKGNLLLAYAGLAVALENVGDFSAAAAAFENGTQVAARTYGLDSQSYWAIASDWAKFRYERGERDAALQAFATLLATLPTERGGYRNGSNASEASQVMRKFGRCLANDGQGARSVELLERARSLLNVSASHGGDAAYLSFDLGKAYEASARRSEAREAYAAGLAMFESQHAPPPTLATAHERWARFLLAQHDLDAATAEFNEALQLSAGHLREASVYALAGLAAVAVARGDARAATEFSTRALRSLDSIEGYYDIRVQPYVWGIRARALLLSGDIAAARALAQKSQDAVQQYFAPDSPAAAETARLAHDLAGATGR